MKVGLDYGHGGKDPGAVAGKVLEKDLVLQIGEKTKELLGVYGDEVILTREDDTFLSLSDRANIVNSKKVDLFISLHCNSAANRAATGFETFYFPGSIQGENLSRCIQEKVHYLNRPDRGAKEGRFAVLRNTHMPAVLFEAGFISNPVEKHLLQLGEYQYLVAEAIAKAVQKYKREG